MIMARLETYRPLLSPMKHIYPDAKGLDLGCGRGEWLETLEAEGIEPLGIDLDDGMLSACRELNLTTVKQDALEFLGQTEDNSISVVSAFHLVEHISFDQLQLLVSESLRVLKPGGLLIMETPNPENIVVGTQNLYLEPTHQRPIPSLLLSFLPEHYGFARTKVLRLQESKTLLQGAALGLFEVFSGASPDYAVVAQKHAKAAILEKFDGEFSKDIGLSLPSLSAHYDERIKAKIDSLQSQTSQIEAQIDASKYEAEQLRITTQTVKIQIDQHEGWIKSVLEESERARSTANTLQHQLHLLEAKFNSAQEEAEFVKMAALQARLENAEAKAHRGEHEARAAIAALQAIHASTSWRITAPMRWLGTQIRLLRIYGLRARLLALYRKIWLGTPQERSVQPIQLTSESMEVAAPPECTKVAAPPPTPAQDPMSTRVQRTIEELQEHLKNPDKVRR